MRLRKEWVAAFFTFSTGLNGVLQTSVFTSFGASSADFQVLPKDQDFENWKSNLDLESGRYVLEYKTSGTSLGFKIKSGNQVVGKFLPQNSAADSEAQVVSFRLGQFLQMSRLVVPSAYYVLGPQATSRFQSMLNSHGENNSLRAENQQSLRQVLSRNSRSLPGVLTPKVDTLEAVDVETENTNAINASHPLASWIRVNGVLPSRERLTSLRGVKRNGKLGVETELELSRQLSKILVLDVLCGQWDRWSGGNLEASVDSSGRVFLLARDNGGASMRGTQWVSRGLQVVSRFDRTQIQRVQQLANLLRGGDAKRIATALELRSDPKFLLARATAVLNRVADLSRQYGEAQVYFAE